jgi:hypothetical protein
MFRLWFSVLVAMELVAKIVSTWLAPKRYVIWYSRVYRRQLAIQV